MIRNILSLAFISAIILTACGKKEPSMQGPPPQPVQEQPQVKEEPKATVDTATKVMEAPKPVMKKKTSGLSFADLPKSMDSGKYTVQVASWSTKEDADKLAGFYDRKGFVPRVEPATVSSSRWYRVRLGWYDSRADAQAVADYVADRYKSDIWVVKP